MKKKRWGRGQDESDFHLSEEWSKDITTSLIGLDAALSTRCCTHLKKHKENSPMVLNQMASPLPINKGCKFNPVQVHDLCYPSDKDTTKKKNRGNSIYVSGLLIQENIKNEKLFCHCSWCRRAISFDGDNKSTITVSKLVRSLKDTIIYSRILHLIKCIAFLMDGYINFKVDLLAVKGGHL